MVFRFWEATSYIFLLTPQSAAETEQYQIKANVTYLACCCSASAGENGATWIQQCCCCCWSLWSCCQDWESPLLCWIPAAALRLQCRVKLRPLCLQTGHCATWTHGHVCAAAASTVCRKYRKSRFTAQCFTYFTHYCITFSNQSTFYFIHPFILLYSRNFPQCDSTK